MKERKNERGAIAILALITVLFMSAFLISSYVILSNKVQAQKEVISQTKSIYETGKSMEEIYNSFFVSEDIIPIYTKSQLLKVGNNDQVAIAETGGKYYNFTATATYVLMNDLNCSQSEIDTAFENNFEGNFEGNFDGNGHTVTITNNQNEECVCSKENNYHGLLINLPTDYRSSIANIVDETPIPKGFKYVKGNKNTGLVITDAFSGEEEIGNEFVWVPVDDINSFTRIAFNNDNLVNNSNTLTGYWIDETTEEYTNLINSIEKYGGFYFGRYETSKVPDIQENIAQIKKNADPWVDIVDSAPGKSSSMYDSDYISTHLVYPQEWDTTLNWIIATDETKTSSLITSNSSTWGNYNVIDLATSHVAPTGSSDSYMANNIYDLAGNVSELTMEKKHTSVNIDRFTSRGGSYIHRGDSAPASHRNAENSAENYLGFRICMMINE